MGTTPRLSLLLLATASLAAVLIDYVLSELGPGPRPPETFIEPAASAPARAADGVEVVEVVEVAEPFAEHVGQ
jgi:hypothetical protein